jgi:putative photosynthetic complex assembly protein 2
VTLAPYALPIGYALVVWWVSTGVILILDGLPTRTFARSLLGASVLAAGALLGLASSRDDASVSGAYLAFTCSVLVWGWQELAFLLGFLAGPRRPECPTTCGSWRHFGHAFVALRRHELALAATGALVLGLTWGGPNRVGAWTFGILWCMRLSAKLNLFLGVPNSGEELLPDHLRYLGRFLRKRPMNLLFPWSVTAATVLTLQLSELARAPGASDADVAGASLLAALAALGLLEHWFLVIPFPTAALWGWSLRGRARPARDELRHKPLQDG